MSRHSLVHIILFTALQITKRHLWADRRQPSNDNGRGI